YIWFLCITDRIIRECSLGFIIPPLTHLSFSHPIIGEVTKRDHCTTTNPSDDDNLSNFTKDVMTFKGVESPTSRSAKLTDDKFKKIFQRSRAACSSTERLESRTGRAYSRYIPFGYLTRIE